jgi:hypothetical protein
MKTNISRERIPAAPAEQLTFAAAKGVVRRSTGRLNIPVPVISALSTLGAIVALWAPAYLGLLDRFGGEFPARSEALEWALVAVGAFGLGSVFYLAWQDTRDPAWRAAHGLPRRGSNAAGR